MPQPNSFVWNTIIRGYQQNNIPLKTLEYFYRMKGLENVKPDRFTYPFVIRACTDRMEFGRGMYLHGEVFKIGVDRDVFVATRLIEMYGEKGDVCHAGRVFDALVVKDKIVWTTMLEQYVIKCGDMEKACELFDLMPSRDLVDWTMIVSGHVNVGNLESAKRFFDDAPDKDLLMYNIILGGYAKNGELEVLVRFFHEMPMRDLVSWNTVIGGLVRGKRINEAIKYFNLMQKENVCPNEVTITTVLSASAQVGALDLGKWLHSFIDRRGIGVSSVVGTALVDMYSKCGDLESAEYVFDTMKEKDVVAWSAMIMGFSMNGQSKNALQLFYRMTNENVKPNDATLLGVLCACVHAGLVDEGRKLFNNMYEQFGLTPQLEHYSCIVDLLGRASLLDEAYDMIKSMPLEPHSGVWGALLGACKLHGKVELAEQAIEHLMQLDHEDGGYLAIMSNIYANAGRWSDVARVRKLMKEKGINKVRGCSAIEINGEIHEFSVGEKMHPHIKEIYHMVDEIYKRLRIVGHVGSTNEVYFDVEEEEKEKALVHHSEKLAVAYGLFATDSNSIIRVVKNLRICADCHAVIKLISGTFNREIVIRDRNRFHHFKEGRCSCGDYW
ncbi:hypothetical protein Leryth_021325 [Lithospermum erythrorhizon]|nr:hypothetical protein Leryth_021325 [Lithospermum erythrorhizon]